MDNFYNVPDSDKNRKEDAKPKLSRKKKNSKCAHCEKLFYGKTDMRKHIKRVHDKIKDHICDVCGKCFSTNQDIKAHGLVHTGELNFPCHICGQRFISKQNLIIHTKIHTGEKPHVCKWCGKTFADESGLKSHIMTHTTIPEIPCEFCGKLFKYKRTLKNHMRRLHNGDGYNKSETGVGKKVFSNDLKLKALKKVEEVGIADTAKVMNIEYRRISDWVKIAKREQCCELCGQSFPYKSPLGLHMKKQHGGYMKLERKTIPVTQHDDSLKTEVVQFALANSRKEAKEKYQVPESTVRMWIQKSQGLDYRPAGKEKVPKVSLDNFLLDSNEEIKLETIRSDPIQAEGPLTKPGEANFLLDVMNNYSGAKLTQVLDKIKCLSNDELGSLIELGDHKSFFDLAFGWGNENYQVIKKKRIRIRKKEVGEAKNDDPVRVGVVFKKELEDTDNKFIELGENEFVEKSVDGHLDINYAKNLKEESLSYDNFEHIKNEAAQDVDDDEDEQISEEDILNVNINQLLSVSVEDEDIHFENVANENYQNNQPEPSCQSISVAEPNYEEAKTDLKYENYVQFPSTDELESNKNRDISHINESSKPVENEWKCKMKRKDNPPCQVCGKTFQRPSDMPRHMVSHTGEKNFNCNVCQDKFPLMNALTRHLKSHEGVCPYSCTYCNVVCCPIEQCNYW